jgi:hypothetical protein
MAPPGRSASAPEGTQGLARRSAIVWARPPAVATEKVYAPRNAPHGGVSTGRNSMGILKRLFGRGETAETAEDRARKQKDQMRYAPAPLQTAEEGQRNRDTMERELDEAREKRNREQ